MSTPLKIFLCALGGIVAVLVLVALIVPRVVDVNVKSRVERAASDALGMEVTVGGQLGIGFFPGVQITLEDVHMRSRGGEIASAKEISLGIALVPLLHQEVRIQTIALKHTRITLERDRDSTFNFNPPEGAKGTFSSLDVNKISLAEGTLLYTDQFSGDGFEAGNCNLDVSRLRFGKEKSPELFPSLSFTAEFTCGEVRTTNV